MNKSRIMKDEAFIRELFNSHKLLTERISFLKDKMYSYDQKLFQNCLEKFV